MMLSLKKITAALFFTLPCSVFAAETSIEPESIVTPTVAPTAFLPSEAPTAVQAETAAPAIDVENLTAQQQAQTLMQKLLPFAADNIAEFGEFYPFGAAVNAKGDIIPVSGHENNEFVELQMALDNMYMRFENGIVEEEFILTATFADQTIQAPGKQLPSPAIAIYLDHKDGFSRVVYLPYMKTAQGVQYGKMLMNAGTGDLFSGK